MEQTLNSTNEQTDSVLSRAKQNFVPSSKQLVKDTIEMITNPVQTAKSLYELGSGIVQLAIPGEQGNEDTARAVGQHFADRYGSIEKAKETFATDPAAFALDALGVITGGAALGVGVAKAGAKAVSKVGRKVDVDDGVADAQLQAANAAKAKEPDRSGMGDLGDGIQPSVYDEALEVSSKYGDNSVFKNFGPEDVDGYFDFMQDTQYLRNSSKLDDIDSVEIFFNTLDEVRYVDKNSPRITKFDEMVDYDPGMGMTFARLKEKKGTFYRQNKDQDKVVLYTDSGKGLGGKRKKSLVIVGGKKQPTKEQILEFLDIDPESVRGKYGEYDEILFDMDKLNEQGIARAERLADDGPQPGLGSSNKGIIEELPNEKGKSVAELKKEYKLKESQRKPQDPELAELAKKLKNKEITSQQYKDAVNRINPVQVLDNVPELVSAKGIEATLGIKTKNKIIGKDITLKEGQRVQSRIDINAYDEYNKYVTTIHEPGSSTTKPIGYGSGVHLTDINVKASQQGGLAIATGKSKASIARVEGNFKSYNMDEISNIAKKEINNPNSKWSQVGYNPQRSSYFYNRKTGLDEVLQSGDEMVQIGNLVLVKNAKFKPREKVLDITGPGGFKKGGTIMGLATGGTPGVADGDGLKDPSILSPKDAKTKAAAADIKKKISGVAKKPQQGNTNIQTAMLLEPEKLLKKYEKPITPPPNVLAANEGAMPVVEEDTQEQSTRQQRRSEIINQLDGAGLSVPAIKAIVGNIDIETGGTFSHTQKQEGGNGYGLFQLDFQKPFYDKYLESQNLEDSISSQVNYFLDEINKGGTIGPGNAKSIMDVFNDPKTTPKEATIVLVDKFFKPGKPHLERRIASAMQGYDEELEGFKEGGLADNADDTPGATESEVADDIPAMISEGELVVPANVVRYHGLSKYENMRKTALNALDALEDNGQIRPVDSDGTPIVKDIKEQTDEVMASKGATVARYNEGGSPKITTGGPRVPTTPARRESTIKYDEQTGTGEYNYTPEGIEKFMKENPDIHHMGMFGKKSYKSYDKDTNEIVITTQDLDARMFDPDSKYTPEVVRYSPEEYFSQEQFTNSEYFNPSDYFLQDLEPVTKGTLTTPEGKDYRVTNPNTKITATGPRTTNIVGGDYTGGANLPGFGVDKETGGGDKKGTVDTVIDELTPYVKAGVTIGALDLLFNQGKITANALGWARDNIFSGQVFNPERWSLFKDGKLKLSYDSVTAGTAATGGAAAEALAAGKSISSQITIVDGKYIFNGVEYTSMDEAVRAGETLKDSLPANADAATTVTSANGVWNWKTGLAAVGGALSLYDIMENGPSVGNVSSLGYSAGVLAQGGVFGSGAAAATAQGTALGGAITVLGWVALAAGLVQMFSGPPSTKVGEAAYNFDNPEYNPNDILSGGFWTKKRSDENIDGAKELVSTVGSYVSSMEEALGINIGGELFIDVGNTQGLRYGYVEGYDELGMYKYHKKDLDYELLHGPGQVGKGYKGEDAVTQLMDQINDDISVITMFALADKSSGGEGYATFDKIGEYRKKINTLSTYRSGMAGSSTQAVLTDQERNLLDGFQKKEFAKVTGDELAALLPIYDKIAPVQQRNTYSFTGLGS